MPSWSSRGVPSTSPDPARIAIVDIACEFDATVDGIAGDGVILLFGASGSRPADAAWSAAQAAVRIRWLAAELAAAARRQGRFWDAHARTALSSGTCELSIIKGETVEAFRVLGRSIRLASLLHAAARPGTILCAGSTRARLGNRAELRRLVELHVDSRSPVDAWEIVDLAPATDQHGATRDQAAPTRSPVQKVAFPTFRPEGDYWTIAGRGSLFRLRDSKGLHYLRALLAEPFSELHVLDWVHAVANQETLLDLGDAGTILDTEAKSAYRRRLSDLEGQLQEATSFGDQERALRAREEMQVLAAQLAGALGLGGRDRRACALAERARVNVARAIKAAISKIGAHNAALGRHFATSVRTGMFCSYRPDSETPLWILG